MEQFLVVFKHEYTMFLKNKIFMVMSIIGIVGALILTSIPRFASMFDLGGDSNGSRDTVVLVDNTGNGQSIKTMMEGAMGHIEVFVGNFSQVELENKIRDGEYSSGFIIDSINHYSYIVESQELYDSKNMVMQEILKVQYQNYLMLESGLSASQAANVLSATVTNDVVEIGVDQAQNFLFTYIMIMFLYVVIMIYGQLIATNVASEKTSRAMEMLITCAKPRSLMFGKIFASGCAGLTQLMTIICAAYGGYLLNREYLIEGSFMEIFNVSVSTLIFGVVFFLLGYFLYAFLYGAIGSTVSKIEDISPAVMPVTFLFIIGFMITIMGTSSGDVNSTLVFISSFIPFFAPMAMLARIGMSVVPPYQIAITIVILLLTIVLIGYMATKIYRLGVMHYGNRMKLKDIFKALRD